jgi:hypothetical protein
MADARFEQRIEIFDHHNQRRHRDGGEYDDTVLTF